ncbi:acylneuraminate cytidylyltransferase [Labedella endophytica]|uniref:N-acylneuraminate cytidylyltransferase n=1 Tax=Labedella endophytica TaxID=1523160 RepID=A0A433JTU8_9MICO|nr:acylneuraminate cytidylyltransferase [Labedella endophytica]RUR01487.1 acylneuraminate cytidylyltransferase [Labedella endophytica]
MDSGQDGTTGASDPSFSDVPLSVVVIPARGGSKGIPGKNLRTVGGIPLIVRAIRSARAARSIDLVVVSTDDADIARIAIDSGAVVVERPDELSGDTASSESAVLHALDAIEADTASGRRPIGTVVLMQATSPLIDPVDLDEAVRRVISGSADVVFSAVPTHVFLWRDGGANEGVVGVNHDRASRPRRQDRAAEYRETGAFYAMDAAGFRSSGHRFFGLVAVQSVPERHAIEIDVPADLELARAVSAIDTPELRATVDDGGELIEVEAVVTDFDGVHTDDTAVVDQDGRESVRIHRGDGHGVRQLRDAGIPVLILSAERNAVVAARAAKLRVDVIHGVDGDDTRGDKGDVLTEWAERIGVPLDRIAYLGNDVGDLPALRIVGWSVVVADAHPTARAAARVVLASRGGSGAVRELADRIIAARTAAPAHDRRDDLPAEHLTNERRSS